MQETQYFHRPFMTFGYNAQFEAGTEIDSGPFSVSGSAYDVAPWGYTNCGQPRVSMQRKRKVRRYRKEYQSQGIFKFQCSERRCEFGEMMDFNASVDVKPVKTIDLEFDYSRSVPLRLNSFSFGIGFDLGAMLRRASVGR